jgi:type II secretory pathway pseudopilin PulG
MKQNAQPHRRAGFTLVEICITLTVLMIVGVLAYSILISSTALLAKNVSLNSSNTILRNALDRIYSEINQSNGLPKLINADGTDAASPSGPAAGIIFDRYVGGPFVVGNPGTGLPATTTSIKLYYSTNPLALPPKPAINDVVRMDAGTRPLVSACSVPSAFSPPIPSFPPNPGQMYTVTFLNPLGRAIPWSSNVEQIAYLVHRKAFVVAPVSGRAELRMYGDAETVTNYNDVNGYKVLTREIGTKTVSGVSEQLPFSLVTQNGTTFLSIDMRVEDQQFNKYLAARQSKEFNTFLRINTKLLPRNFLK